MPETQRTTQNIIVVEPTIEKISRLELYRYAHDFPALATVLFEDKLPERFSGSESGLELILHDFEERGIEHADFLPFPNMQREIIAISYELFEKKKRKTYTSGPFFQHPLGAAEIIASCADPSYEKLPELLSAVYLSVVINHSPEKIPHAFMKKYPEVVNFSMPQYRTLVHGADSSKERVALKIDVFSKHDRHCCSPEFLIIALALGIEYITTDNHKLEEYHENHHDLMSLEPYLKKLKVNPMERYQNLKRFYDSILWKMLNYDEDFTGIDMFKLGEWYDAGLKRMKVLLGL